MKQITFYGNRGTDTSNLLQKTLAAVTKLRPTLICQGAIGLEYSRRPGKANPLILLRSRPCGCRFAPALIQAPASPWDDWRMF